MGAGAPGNANIPKTSPRSPAEQFRTCEGALSCLRSLGLKTGFICINSPLVAGRVSSLSTKTAHPQFLATVQISGSHLYNLRRSAGYCAQGVVATKNRRSRWVEIGVRRAPLPTGRGGFIRIGSAHPQRDHDGIKVLHHINAVDCVTQRQVVAAVQTISEVHMLADANRGLR